MRWVLALVLAGGLSLGLSTPSQAQMAVSVSPWGGLGGVVANPYGYYSSGYYGLGGVGYVPGAAVYSSGYYGVAPVVPAASAVMYPYRYAPAYRYYGGVVPVRRGLFGRPRVVGGYW